MTLAVVLNETAGTLLGTPVARAATEIERGFAVFGVTARVTAAPGAAIEAEIRRAIASNVDAVIIGGGDGTVATAAGLLLGTGKALGLLPLGTMNLLARDLGMPSDLAPAVAALAQGRIRHIDVAEVNGHIFLNNSVLGLYPSLVRARERQRGVSGWRLWPAMISAVFKALRYYNLIEISVDLGQGPRWVKTPALAVVNNAYRDCSDAFLDRPALDDGHLAVYVANHHTRLGLIRLMSGLVLGGWQSDAELEALTVAELTVTSRHRHRRLRVANDGEVFRLAPPLIYRIHPKALPVLVPVSPAAGKPSP